MKHYQLIGFFVACTVAFPSAVYAGPFQNRLNRQDLRIYRGVQNGSLNAKEYHRIERRSEITQAKLYRDINDCGGLTVPEAARINRRLRNQSRKVYRLKHN